MLAGLDSATVLDWHISHKHEMIWKSLPEDAGHIRESCYFGFCVFSTFSRVNRIDVWTLILTERPYICFYWQANNYILYIYISQVSVSNLKGLINQRNWRMFIDKLLFTVWSMIIICVYCIQVTQFCTWLLGQQKFDMTFQVQCLRKLSLNSKHSI